MWRISRSGIARKESCSGRLRDTVLREGENVPVSAMEEALQCVHRADVCLVLGTRLHRLPAARIPAFAIRSGARGLGARLVVCSSFETSLDELANVRLWERSTPTLDGLLATIGYEPDAFSEQRRFIITSHYVANQPEKYWKIIIEAHDICGVPLATMDTCTVKTNGHGEFFMRTLSKRRAVLELYTARKHVGDAEVRIYFAKSTRFPYLLLHHMLDPASMSDGGFQKKWDATAVKKNGRLCWETNLSWCNKHKIRIRKRSKGRKDEEKVGYSYTFKGYYTDIK